MDLVIAVAVAAAVGLPLVRRALRQEMATPRGYLDPAPAYDPLIGPAREVGTPDLPREGVPTSLTDHARSVS